MVEFDTRVQFLKGVGETRAKHLEKLGIFSIGALLRYYPKRYEDWNNITKISEVPLNETVCLKATVIERVQDVKIKGGKILERGRKGAGLGTTFVVRDLFYNTPARYKHLSNLN